MSSVQAIIMIMARVMGRGEMLLYYSSAVCTDWNSPAYVYKCTCTWCRYMYICKLCLCDCLVWLWLLCRDTDPCCFYCCRVGTLTRWRPRSGIMQILPNRRPLRNWRKVRYCLARNQGATCRSISGLYTDRSHQTTRTKQKQKKIH